VSRLDSAPDLLAATLGDYLRTPRQAPPAPVRPDQGTPPPPAAPDDWWEHAACKGKPAAIFFPEPIGQCGLVANEPLYDRARAICRTCSAICACGDWARRNKERDGCWGGKTPRERGVKARGGRRADHGTTSKYVAGCRCNLCSAAKRAYDQRRWAARKAAQS
jgi:WhiB family redox-sensing transcriptional regulator